MQFVYTVKWRNCMTLVIFVESVSGASSYGEVGCEYDEYVVTVTPIVGTMTVRDNQTATC